MAEFRRDIYTRLSAWAEATEHKPIVLCGARQVGKTHVLKVLGRDKFESFSYDAPIHCQAFGCVVLGWLSSVSTGWPVARVREGRVRRVRSR